MIVVGGKVQFGAIQTASSIPRGAAARISRAVQFAREGMNMAGQAT
jgi:hypothetical protein